MKVLLDTQIFLWFITDDPRLSGPARQLIESADTNALLSIASLWEIAIKTSLGKLTLAAPFEELIPTQILETGVEVLPIQMNHLTKLVSLPFHHRDPFDRLLAAQALAEGIQLISVDKVFSAYSVQSLW